MSRCRSNHKHVVVSALPGILFDPVLYWSLLSFSVSLAQSVMLDFAWSVMLDLFLCVMLDLTLSVKLDHTWSVMLDLAQRGR